MRKERKISWEKTMIKARIGIVLYYIKFDEYVIKNVYRI